MPTSTASGPTASSMGQAISIPVNLNRMGSDGGGAQVKESYPFGYNWKKLADGTLNSPLAQRAANAVAERSRTAIDEPPVVEQPDWAAAGGNWAREFFDAPGFG